MPSGVHCVIGEGIHNESDFALNNDVSKGKLKKWQGGKGVGE